MKISFTVFGKPIAKGRPKFFRRGNFVGTYTPKKTQQGEYDFKLQSLKYKPKIPFTSPLFVAIKICVPIPKALSIKKKEMLNNGILYPAKRPDIDNYIKLVLDSLNKIFWDDDSQIVKCYGIKVYAVVPRTGNRNTRTVVKGKGNMKITRNYLVKTCNQCGKNFEYHADFPKNTVNVCTNPDCPNYALYQIAEEDMPGERFAKGERP